MYARLGNYITRGAITVSGSFHPFGGAVDIVVVEQQNGSFKSSPWYVKFGKFQGVLKAKEKVVNINVNGVEANFQMYLDNKGEAYFLREVNLEEGNDCILSPSSSGEETDDSKIRNGDANQSNSVTKIEGSNGKVVARTSSRRSRILGLVFGRKSMKKDRFGEEEYNAGVVRADSLERAEIAADLLELKWSTNLVSRRQMKDTNGSRFSASHIWDGEANKDLQSSVDSLGHDKMVNNSDNPLSHEDSSSSDLDAGNFSLSAIQKLERSVDETGGEMPCLINGTLNLGQSGFEGNNELNPERLTKKDEIGVANADHYENVKGVNSEIVYHDPQIPDSLMLEACQSQKLVEEHDYDEDDGGVSNEEHGSDRRLDFFHRDASESSLTELNGFSEHANETLNLSCGECGEVSVHAKTLHETTELISEVLSQPETGVLVANNPLNLHESLGDENCCNFFNDANILESEIVPSNINSIVTETYSDTVTVHSVIGSAKDVVSSSVLTASSFNNSICQVHDEKNTLEQDKMNKLRLYLELVGNSQEVTDDFDPTEATNSSPSEGSEEEQFLPSDLDDFKCSQVKWTESISLDHWEKENNSSLISEGIEAPKESFSSYYESDSSPDKFVQENLPNDVEELRQTPDIKSSHINIPTSSKVSGQEVGRMVESLPNMWSQFDELDVHHLHHSLGHSLDSNSKSSKWTLLRKDVSSCIKSDADDENQLSNSELTIEDAQVSEELVNLHTSTAVGDPSKIIDASSGSWRLRSFPSQKSRSMKVSQPALNFTRNVYADNALESTSAMDVEKDVSKPKVKKKEIRAITPTSEQLASLNLKEGKNTVTFTFSTAMLGMQQIDARIYLWRWDTRIVISDVDGTITKSDVLGQFMPLVGKDWSQTGVAHLFTAIKENGYQMLFLSARAISQAYQTRQFLFNLKQDGKALPDGPVVISPDGLFPSLFREVIRRAPHEFKIACLEDIKALFPADRNPFYAGFGNRDTDEFSYIKVGIPKGKIFIINPKGEVAVNRSVDTKSYTSLHALVNGMFPPMSSSEQEDYNSWNFWRLPPPVIDI